MERFPRHRKVRHVLAPAPLAIAFVTVLALALVAAAAMAATNGTRGAAAPGPNGCPTNKSLKTAPIADLAAAGADCRSPRSTCCPGRSTSRRRPSR